MNRDDIFRMAQEVAGVSYPINTEGVTIGMKQDHLERFAAAIASVEREECAKVCESLNEDFDSLHVEACAEAIRERGQS